MGPDWKGRKKVGRCIMMPKRDSEGALAKDEDGRKLQKDRSKSTAEVPSK